MTGQPSTSRSDAAPLPQAFSNGLVKEALGRVDAGLRALEANRLDDAHRILILLERDLQAQVQWEQG